MTFLSRFAAGRLGLGPATQKVRVERDLRTTMPDGVVLLADRYFAPAAPGQPLILIRSPYGRRSVAGLLARIIAERGFQVLMQSTRGTRDSGGVFVPFAHEREDGLATIDWVLKQPWYGGRLATFGPSYLGNVQWAVCDSPEIVAMAAQVTSATFEPTMYQGGGFSLDDAFLWAANQEHVMGVLNPRRFGFNDRVRRRFLDLPLSSVGRDISGKQYAWLGRWLDRDAGYWAGCDHRPLVAGTTAPMHITTGWYDFALPQTMADYATLVAAGRRPHLTIGPWWHGDMGMFGIALGESLGWFRSHLLDDPSGVRELPVRLFVTGADEWREYPSWPSGPERTWYLGPALADEPGEGSDSYVFDPADPTPLPGGPLLNSDGKPVVDNRAHEERADVLVYTSEPLPADLEAIGAVRADLVVRTSREHADFVVRLCDVHPSGESRNVCDGLVRTSGSGTREVRVELWPTAHRFAAGHRLRVQVASGAHPRLVRNHGTGEPLGTGVELLPCEVEVLHTSSLTVSLGLPPA
ncbi:CocE/NonD family hydrolase [Nonomuraea sp. NPDC050556]|uniref:CocE/NonD family hydrolase n=1 Tax=Nonomuraea sp. NPDC050556 TaxID=3364369 RepID=UPI0037B7B8E5